MTLLELDWIDKAWYKLGIRSSAREWMSFLQTYGYWDAYNPAIRRPFHHITHVGYYPSPSVEEIFSRDFWRRALDHPFLTPEGADKRFVCQRCEAKRSICFIVS